MRCVCGGGGEVGAAVKGGEGRGRETIICRRRRQQHGPPHRHSPSQEAPQLPQALWERRVHGAAGSRAACAGGRGPAGGVSTRQTQTQRSWRCAVSSWPGFTCALQPPQAADAVDRLPPHLSQLPARLRLCPRQRGTCPGAARCGAGCVAGLWERHTRRGVSVCVCVCGCVGSAVPEEQGKQAGVCYVPCLGGGCCLGKPCLAVQGRAASVPGAPCCWAAWHALSDSVLSRLSVRQLGGRPCSASHPHTLPAFTRIASEPQLSAPHPGPRCPALCSLNTHRRHHQRGQSPSAGRHLALSYPQRRRTPVLRT